MDEKELSKKLFDITIERIKTFGAFGRLGAVEAEIKAFKEDHVFHSFGLNNGKFVRDRIRGAFVMSVTRKLGDLFEKYVKTIIKFKLGLSDEDIKYSAIIQGKNRSLEAVIHLTDVNSGKLRSKIDGIIKKETRNFITTPTYKSIGFEVRYSYLIGDSKRIQADEAMALHLHKEGILPIMLIFSTIYLRDPVRRLGRTWKIKIGKDAFSFLKDVTDFDLYQFLVENGQEFSAETSKVLAEVEKRYES